MASLLAELAAGVGALPVLFLKGGVPRRLIDGVLGLAAGILPWALGFAAGAMLYVVSDEMIPESHREGREREATTGVVLGFLLMMVLDNVLG